MTNPTLCCCSFTKPFGMLLCQNVRLISARLYPTHSYHKRTGVMHWQISKSFHYNLHVKSDSFVIYICCRWFIWRCLLHDSVCQFTANTAMSMNWLWYTVRWCSFEYIVSCAQMQLLTSEMRESLSSILAETVTRHCSMLCHTIWTRGPKDDSCRIYVRYQIFLKIIFMSIGTTRFSVQIMPDVGTLTSIVCALLCQQSVCEHP